MTKTLKPLAVNSFIAWRMSQKEDLLLSKDAFGSRQIYRGSPNHVPPLADFILDSSQYLLTYAEKHEKCSDSAKNDIVKVTGEN